MTPEKIINDILHDWSREFIDRRQAGVRKENLLSSQELLQSFRAAVAMASPGQNARVQLLFATHGRYLDMKKIQFGKKPDQASIEDYVRKKGVENFRQKHRRVRDYIPKDEDKLIADIAFGIGIGILRKNRFRRRRWYNKPAYQGINILYRRLLDGLAGFSAEDIRNAITPDG